MMIIQYIRSLIYACEKNIKQNRDEINFHSYSGLICCNLLSILNDEYAHECVCDSDDTNLSNFKVFTDIIIENNSQYLKLKNEKENLEIENEKLQRKLKQKYHHHYSPRYNQTGGMQPMHHTQLSTTNTPQSHDMKGIPHTPQITDYEPQVK